MKLKKLEDRGRELAREGLPLGAALRRVADELDRELDDFDDHERRAFSDGWHETMRENSPNSDGSDDSP
ncbi:MAG: hypothetical protein ABEL76_06040 [Bradymonadaceae bacterium]